LIAGLLRAVAWEARPRFQVSPHENFTELVVNATTVGAVSTFTPLVNLPVNTTYHWRVRANGAKGPSLWSPAWLFTVVP